MKAPAGPMKEERLSANADEALEQMMRLYGTKVLRTVYFYTGDRHMAEDISQDTFIRAYRGWTKFHGGSSVLTWLIRIAVNLCKDKLGLKMAAEQPTDPVVLESGAAWHVEHEALAKWTRSEIARHVMALSLPYREVLHLYYYLDMSTREIADSLALPEGTVRARLHRAREQLGQMMTREEFGI